MKYLQITPATSDKMGECVLPTIEMPPKPSFGDRISDDISIEKWKEWEEHLKDRPKLDTTCTLPAGEWFEGKPQWNVLEDSGMWYDCSEANFNATSQDNRRIVPVEQKAAKYKCVHAECGKVICDCGVSESPYVEQKDEPKRDGMEEVTIYRYQLDAILEALRVAANSYDLRKQETCLGRMVTQAERFAKNALNGEKDKYARYGQSFPQPDEKVN